MEGTLIGKVSENYMKWVMFVVTQDHCFSIMVFPIETEEKNRECVCGCVHAY